MQCVEFEVRLNDLIDGRVSPTADTVLFAHAESCANCSELLAAHEMLLEGVATLPAVRLSAAERQALAKRVAAEVGSLPAGLFPAAGEVELVECRPAMVATNARAPWTLIGLLFATAAAVLIAVLPWRRPENPPNGADMPRHLVVDEQKQPSVESPAPTLAYKNHEGLEPIAWVGYQVADGLKPVTNSMVSALRELRKRPLFRNADENGRSSFYLPRDQRENLA